jgi:heme a synthase
VYSEITPISRSFRTSSLALVKWNVKHTDAEDQLLTRLLFISTKNRWFFRLTLLGTLFAFTFILLSAYSNIFGTAPACTTWPMCNGHWLIANPYASITATRAWLTMLSRYVIMANTPLIILMLVTAASLQRQFGPRPFFICLGLLVVAGAQLALSRLAIIASLQPLVTVGSFLLGLLSLSLFWWTSQISRPNSISSSHPSLKMIRPWAWIGLVFLVLQIIFGGWLTIGNMGCENFPYCSMHLTPPVEWRQVLHLPQKTLQPDVKAQLHLLHRLGALLGFAYLVAFSFLLLFNRYIYQIAFFIFILLAMQFSLGISSITWLDAPSLVITQHAVMILLLLGLVSLLISLYNKPQDFWYG